MKRSIAWLVACGLVCAIGAQGAVILGSEDNLDGGQDLWQDTPDGLDPNSSWSDAGGLGAQIHQSSTGDGGAGGAFEFVYTTDSDFTGDWAAMGSDGVKQIKFDFYREPGLGGTPNVEVYFEDAVSGAIWYYQLSGEIADGWGSYSVPVDFGAGWYSPGPPLGGGTQGDFLSSIQTVQEVGFYLGYVAGEDDQTFGFDDFLFDDAVNTPEPGTFLFLGVAFASMGMSFRKRLREMLAALLKK